MDSSQQFCLKWNNYHNHVVNAFESLREDEDFVDVTLACDGKKLQAHKMLLSACSPYFRDLLKGNPCKHPIILLRDVKFKDLQALVEFMYCGQVNVLQEQLGSFLKTAEALQVRGLADSNKRDSELREDDDNSRTSSPQISRSCSPPKRFKTHNFKNSDIVNETVMPVVVPKIEVPEEEEEFIGNDVSELQADESVYGEQKVEKDSSMSESGEYPSCSGDIDYSSPMVDANQYSSESQENSVHHHAIAPDPSNETNQSATLTPQDTVQEYGTTRPKFKSSYGNMCEDMKTVFKCHSCDKTFKHRVSFQQHQHVHYGHTTCYVCGLRLSRIYELKRHLKKIHGVPFGAHDNYDTNP